MAYGASPLLHSSGNVGTLGGQATKIWDSKRQVLRNMWWKNHPCQQTDTPQYYIVRIHSEDEEDLPIDTGFHHPAATEKGLDNLDFHHQKGDAKQ